MAKKKTTAKKDDSANGLWVSSRSLLKTAGERTGENRRGGIPKSARYLELADLALGLKKPAPHKKKAAAAGTHITTKTDPYSEQR